MSEVARLCRRTPVVLIASLLGFALTSSVGWAASEPAAPLLLAQNDGTTAEEPPPVSSLPDSFTATFGDWLLRCQRSPDPAVTVKICDVSTVVVAEGQSQPFAQISVSKAADGAFHLTAVVPVNITVGVVPVVGLDDADPGVEMPWVACTPGGCIADLLLNDESLARYRAYAKAGRLVFLDSIGNQIRVNFSFRGMAQAMDSMSLEQISK